MSLKTIAKFLKSSTFRLAASYLLIIMTLCICFSAVIYQTSAHELGRRVPPPSLLDDNGPGNGPHYHEYDRFFNERIGESRRALLARLAVLNLSALLLGAALSYFLARRTLTPIENAMAAQSRFVSDASHELRTPLTSMLTTNEVALRKSKLTLLQAKEVIKSNTEDVKQLKDLTDGLLSMAVQDQPLRLEDISLQDITAEAINRIVNLAQNKQINVQDSVADIPVKADRQQLTQALVILLDNAIKYSPKKSTIRLESGPGKRVSVIDEGEGINPADLTHIFDRFYRADSSRTKSDTQGYGIGLSIAKQIVERHHGRIAVDSSLGSGSTFTIELP